MGLFGIALSIASVLVVGAGGTAAYLYGTDYQVHATVTGKDCVAHTVSIETKQFALRHTMKDVPQQQCGALSKGNFVEYNIRSKHTVVFDVEGGQCIYDNQDLSRCFYRLST